jgi:hypothetical protein
MFFKEDKTFLAFFFRELRDGCTRAADCEATEAHASYGVGGWHASTAQAVAPSGLTSRDKKHYSLLTRGALGEQDFQEAKKLFSSFVSHVNDDNDDFGSNMVIIGASNQLMKTVSRESILLEKAVCSLEESERDDKLTYALCDEMSARVAEARSSMEDRKERRAICAEKLLPAISSTAQEKKQLLGTFCNGVAHGRRLEKELRATNLAENR